MLAKEAKQIYSIRSATSGLRYIKRLDSWNLGELLKVLFIQKHL